MPVVDMLGERVGRLTVLEQSGKDRHGNIHWRCSCDCGAETRVSGAHLRAGRTKSCGCLHREWAVKRCTTHGMSEYPEYPIWRAMLQRCSNPKNAEYKNYGARGISVDPVWRSFEVFMADMGHRPSAAHEIDRRNTNGNYESDNCRWVTRAENCRNFRHAKWWVIDGVVFNSVSHAAGFLGVACSTVMRWCIGRTRDGKFYAPRSSCSSIAKY